MDEIKCEPFFANVDFDKILTKSIPAPFIPATSNEKDVQYFDEEFTSEVPQNTFIPDKKMEVINANQNKFNEFNK
ncbi:MAG: hypothetical protein MJ252_10245 [archaeon]|nr:hypothetical protein [archaeon]